MIEFLIGSTEEPRSAGRMWSAGIDVTEDNEIEHFNRIQVYGSTREDAERLRDWVFKALKG